MMKKHFTLITSLLLFSWSAIAQVSVTFQVDMTQEEISEDGVFVTGNWMDDAGLGGEWEEPGSNEDARMTDGNGNGIYTLTVMLPAGEYQYKYANGSGFVNAEAGGDSDNYQADLSDCGGVDNGFGGYNRTLTVADGEAELFLEAFQFNSCVTAEIISADVTFRVDMGQETVSEDGVFVTGNWMDDAGLGGEWQEPGSNTDAQLTDEDGDGIYTLTVTIPAGDYLYKYANGSGFVNAEAGGDSDNYQADLSDCGGVDNGFGGYNRTMTVPEGASELTLQLFVFNACELTSSTSAPISTIRGISIAPNPMSSYALITIDNPSFTKHDVTIYDMMGRAVRQFRQVQTNVEIQRSDLVAGMYHAVFSNEKGEVMTAKFIVR